MFEERLGEAAIRARKSRIIGRVSDSGHAEMGVQPIIHPSDGFQHFAAKVFLRIKCFDFGQRMVEGDPLQNRRFESGHR